nr:MAG TPA: hypothetical protein [Caudoviricetes sp.]
MHLNQLIKLNCKSRREMDHASTTRRLLYCPAATGEHTSTDQQPECTSRAILILLSCGTVRVCTPAGYGIDTGHCSIILSAWQHTAKRVPYHPAQ